MSKVILVRPPILQLRSNLSAYGAIPPIGIAYIAAVLRDAGYQIQIIDAAGEALDRFSDVSSPMGVLTLQGLSPDKIVERIPVDAEVVAFTHMFLHEWPTIHEICEKVKRRLPHISTILGGENATAFWKKIFEETKAIDFCVLGEGERTILKLLGELHEGKLKSDIRGVVSRAQGPLQSFELSERIADIKKLPWPAWDLFPIEKYMRITDSHGVHRGRSMPILATRGCPFDCTFCSSPAMWTRRYTTREPADVVLEIKSYVDRYGISNVNFCDLTAIIQKEWILAFCKELSRQPFRITWQLPTGTRSEALDFEVLQQMYVTGCRNITYAPESGSERMLKILKKKIDRKAMLNSLRAARKAGLVTRVNIIVGHPLEQFSDLWESLWFLLQSAWLGCDDSAVMIFAPYPGSEDTEKLMSSGKVVWTDDYYYLALARSGWSSRTYNPLMATWFLILVQYTMLVIFYAIAYLTRPWRILSAISCLWTGAETTQLDQLLRTKFRK